VQLSSWTFLAHPMHMLVAAKGGVIGMNTICSIALIVPFKQQLMLRSYKRGLLCLPSNWYYSEDMRCHVAHVVQLELATHGCR